MKSFFFLFEALADRSYPELSGRTPLEASKTPQLDLLAASGKIGQVYWVPAAYPARFEMAAMTALGVELKDYYCGLAPMELCSYDQQKPQPGQVYFKLDFMTVSEGRFAEDHALVLSSAETKALHEALNPIFKKHGLTLVVDNFLNAIVYGPDRFNAVDMLEIVSPDQLKTQYVAKTVAKSKTLSKYTQVIEECSQVLEAHEINRVRVDLGENPANTIWLWGWGKCPKMPLFTPHRYESAAVVTNSSFVRGLASWVGITVYESFEVALAKADRLFVAWDQTSLMGPQELKDRIAWVESCDKMVELCVKTVKSKSEGVSYIVSTDLPRLSTSSSTSHGQVPILIGSDSVQAQETRGFNEKSALSSEIVFDQPGMIWDRFIELQ